MTEWHQRTSTEPDKCSQRCMHGGMDECTVIQSMNIVKQTRNKPSRFIKESQHESYAASCLATSGLRAACNVHDTHDERHASNFTSAPAHLVVERPSRARRPTG